MGVAIGGDKKINKYGPSSSHLMLALKEFEKKEEELGKYHPGLTDNLVALAQIYEGIGRHKKAERIYRRILKIWKCAFVPRYGFRHFLSDIVGGGLTKNRPAFRFREDDVLNLSSDLFLGEGCNRSCYAYPGKPDMCIKIDKPWNECAHNSRRIRIKKALMPWLTSISCNGEEARFYWTKARKLGEKIYRHAPRCYGIVLTSLGPGLVLERVRDYDGNYSDRLDRYLRKHPENREHLLSLVEELISFFETMNIFLLCWNYDNLLVKQDSKQDDHLVAIDWKSEHKPNDDLPLTTIFPFLARRKMKRKIEELKGWIRSFDAQSES